MVAGIVAVGIVVGALFMFLPRSPNYGPANRELTKYWNVFQKHPNAFGTLEITLALYHWPTSQSAQLAHKLDYEIQAFELGENRSGDWHVTYLLLLSALGASDPFS